MKTCKYELAAIFLTATVLPTTSSAYGAQTISEYPDRPITLVIGFPTGGATDNLARLLAKHMTDDLGQKVVIENRPGAAGNIAAASSPT